MTAFAREQAARVAAAAAAARERDDAPHGPVGNGFTQFMVGIARATREHVKAALAPRDARLDAIERRLGASDARIAELEAREYQGTWKAEHAYSKGAMVTYDGSTWIAHAPSIGVRPATSPMWQLAVRKGRDGKDAR